jgi:hypothetical protein
MKIANVKGMVAKGMMVVLAAGALMVAVPAKADAQGFAVGVQFGAPHRGYDRFEFERREAFLRHEEWVREHRFERPFGYRGYR